MSIIDARIPLGVTPMQLESPTDQMGKAMQLRSMSDQQHANALKLQEAEQVQSDRAALGRAMQGGMVRKSVLERLAQEAPHLIPGVTKQFDEMDKAATDLRTARAAATTAERSFISGAAAKMREHGYAPDVFAIELDYIDEQFPEWKPVTAKMREQAQAGGPEAIKQLVDGLIATTPEVAADIRADEDHDATLPGKKADSTRKVTESLDAQLVTEGRLLGAATNTAEWQAALAQLPPDRAKQYPATYSPAKKAFIVKAAQTAQERIDNAIKQQNANTQSASQAETARHNKFMREREKTGSYQWALDPRDGKVRLMSPDEIRKVDAGQAPTADMRNKESARPAVQRGITAIRELGKEIFTKVGPAQRAQAIKRGADAVFGNDPVFRTYQDARMATAGALAVEQQGARVSDMDVKALWLPMIPDAYRDTKESWDLKWALIDDTRGAAKSDDSPAGDAGGNTPLPSYQDYLNSKRKPGGGQ